MRGLRGTLAPLGTVVIAVAGCAEAPAGLRYDLTVTPRSNACGGGPRDVEALTYRVQVAGADATLWLGDEPRAFATGTVRGCVLTYAGDTIVQTRGDDQVSWQLTGEATVTLGDGCAAGDGWVGTEIVTVISSTSREAPPGCEVVQDVAGTFLGEPS